MAAPLLRPLGIGETLDVAIKIYTRNASTLFRLVLFIVAPINLLSLAVRASAPQSDIGFTIDQATGRFHVDRSGLWTYLGGLLVSVLLVLLATTFASAACFKAVADAYLGEQSDWRRSLAYSARRFRSILWVSLLGWLLVAVGTVFCLIPGIYLWVAFVIAVPVVLTEELRGRKALGRARDLVRGRWWKVFAVVLLGTLLTSIVGGVFSAVGSAAIFAGNDVNTVPGFVVQFLTDTVANTLTVPFTAAFVTVVYFDLRVRKEAFDLELLAKQIGVDPAGGAALPIAPLAPLPGPPPGSTPPYWPPPPGWELPPDARSGL